MGIFSGLFKSRDKPQNRTAGSNYAFAVATTPLSLCMTVAVFYLYEKPEQFPTPADRPSTSVPLWACGRSQFYYM